MINADQIFLHLVGDYVLQSQWMADNKSKRTWPCLIHVVAYTLPFMMLTRSWPALLFILSTHALIDRYQLARYVIWAKNHLAPFAWLNVDPHDYDTYLSWTVWKPFPRWKECQKTGFHDQTTTPAPLWLRTWLLIIVDNTLHIGLNGLAITCL